MVRPEFLTFCKIRTWILPALLLLLSAPPVLAEGVIAGTWETWSSDTYTLVPQESFQMRISYDDIKVRSWKLVVEGAETRTCDLTVLRVNGESLLYHKIAESRHEVLIPWGEGEEIIMVITNNAIKGSFVISFMGPPKNQVHASYSYHVNRALDAYAAGRNPEAEAECKNALIKDPDDGVAMVLLAGLLRDRRFYDRAALLVDQALQTDLPGDMRTVADALQADLKKLRQPWPAEVRYGIQDAEDRLTANDPQAALEICQKLLKSELVMESMAFSQLYLLQGQALDRLDRNFESTDAYTNALQLNQGKSGEAIIYFHMGNLFLKMENLAQSEGSYSAALQLGLPADLEAEARDSLKTVNARMDAERE